MEYKQTKEHREKLSKAMLGRKKQVVYEEDLEKVMEKAKRKAQERLKELKIVDKENVVLTITAAASIARNYYFVTFAEDVIGLERALDRMEGYLRNMWTEVVEVVAVAEEAEVVTVGKKDLGERSGYGYAVDKNAREDYLERRSQLARNKEEEWWEVRAPTIIEFMEDMSKGMGSLLSPRT